MLMRVGLMLTVVCFSDLLPLVYVIFVHHGIKEKPDAVWTLDGDIGQFTTPETKDATYLSY
jgi:hypothetical protein